MQRGSWMKKYQFIVLFCVLACILGSVVGFIYVYHNPYTTHKAMLNQIKQELIQNNNLSLTDLAEYNSTNVYYITSDDQKIYVFNEDQELIKYEDKKNIDEEKIKTILKENYNVDERAKLDLGYENKNLCYRCFNEVDGKLQYIYLNAIDGTEIKMYELEK